MPEIEKILNQESGAMAPGFEAKVRAEAKLGLGTIHDRLNESIQKLPDVALKQTVSALFGDDAAELAEPFINYINIAITVATIAAEIVEAQNFKKKWGYALNHPAHKAFYLDVDYSATPRTVAVLTEPSAQLARPPSPRTRPGLVTQLSGGARGVGTASSLRATPQSTTLQPPARTDVIYPVLDIHAYVYYRLTGRRGSSR